ncbi:hypothetical protein HBB16_10470 [Pseudonocardia sp. MCCB 268]|nr:hypothetical protein [Pseudonocardia cytotoxica]
MTSPAATNNDARHQLPAGGVPPTATCSPSSVRQQLLGGFAVVATAAHAACGRWGQFRPGMDTVTFREIDLAQAAALDEHLGRVLDSRHLATV